MLPTVRAMYRVVTGILALSDQFLYTDSWFQITTVVPPRVRFCMNRQEESKVLEVQLARWKDKVLEKIIHQGDPEEETIFPSLYIPTA